MTSREYLPIFVLCCLLQGCLIVAPSDSTDETDPNEAGRPPIRHHVTTLEIGDEATGLDLDGDGTIDNALPAFLAQLNAELYQQIIEAILDACVRQAGDAGEELCTVEVLQADYGEELKWVQEVLDDWLTVEALESGLNLPIAQGGIVYTAAVAGCSDDGQGTPELSWYSNAGPYGASDEQLVTVLSGDEGCSDTAPFGPTSLTFPLSVAPPQTWPFANTLYYVEVPLVAFSTRFDATDGSSGVIGGAITVETLVDVAARVFSLVPQSDIETRVGLVGGKEAFNLRGIFARLSAGSRAGVNQNIMDPLEPLRTTLQEGADLDLDQDGTGDAFSLAIKFETEPE